MRLINRKGFTMIEMLTAITIMGILMLVAGAAVSIYLTKAKENAYVTMAQAARQAAEEYIMEYPGNALTEAEYKKMEAENNFDLSKAVTFDELTTLRIMKAPTDPETRTTNCEGRVFIYLNNTSANNERALDSYSYVVHECCINNKRKYTYSQKYVKAGTNEVCVDDSEEDCEYIDDNSIEYASVLCPEFDT